MLRNALRSRRTRREVAHRQASSSRPAAGRIRIAVYFADTRVNLYQIRQWYSHARRARRDVPGRDPHPQPGRDALAAGRVAGAGGLLPPRHRPRAVRRRAGHPDRLLREPEHQELPDVPLRPHVARVHQPRRVGQDVHDHEPVQGVRLRLRGRAGRARPARAASSGTSTSTARRSRSDARRPTTSPARCRTRTTTAPSCSTRPTWEGDRPTAAYGSIASHGVALADAVLASPRHRLVYRPHPRSGVIDPEYKAANERIIAAIAAANSRDSVGAPRLRRRLGARLAARRGGCRDHRHLGDGLRPARDRQADRRRPAGVSPTPRSTRPDSSARPSG